MNDNFHNIPDLAETLREVGYDYVRFKPVVDYEKRGLNLSDDAVSFVKTHKPWPSTDCTTRSSPIGKAFARGLVVFSGRILLEHRTLPQLHH